MDELDIIVDDHNLGDSSLPRGNTGSIRKHGNAKGTEESLASDSQGRISITSHGSYNAPGYHFVIAEDALPLKVDKQPPALIPAARPPPRKSSRHVLSRSENSIVKMPVLQSRWIDQSLDRGNLSIELVVQPQDGTASADHSPTSTTWYHLQRNHLSFDEFAAVSEDVAHVSDEGRRQVAELL